MHIHAYLCIFIQMQLEMSQHFHVHCSGPYLACRVGTGHIVDQPIGSTYLYLDLECVALHLVTAVGGVDGHGVLAACLPDCVSLYLALYTPIYFHKAQ